ncbi:hypothetical protein [Lederbergia citrea]|uniref:hypothetical protein n=1 Tax=Lederbergia citrea TaxID=2833581 RepID=UPI001BC8CC2B|nr:hypothetical protein [Lederbergia citrea]MBS4178816.1 hypothetical protein [Lederbergia citrea]MBS4205498.1 hypothetical protein [Lederbergia citrea]
MERETTFFKKDITWNILDRKYIVRNVPYTVSDTEDEQFLDLDVSMRLTALRDLMFENEIPHDINYEDIAHIEF